VIKRQFTICKPTATDDDQRCLAKIGLSKFTERVENGLNTTIGEGGIKVSGGRKQRLSIARTLLRNQNYYFDRTSALDSITEEEIKNHPKHILTSSKRIKLPY
jgi:ATP-binding cassette subfamily B protein